MTSKDTYDPGWNDPPIFTYDKAAAIQAAAANKKGASLNKRVAFPITKNSEKEKNDQTGFPLTGDSSKPPPMSHPQLPPSLPKSLEQSEESRRVHKAELEIGSQDRLKRVLENLQVKGNSNEEISKRIKIMEKMWADGKLEEEIQCKVYDLSEALAKGDTETADHIQMGLMVDYVSQCSSWMSGIRRLINQNKSDKDQ